MPEGTAQLSFLANAGPLTVAKTTEGHLGVLLTPQYDATTWHRVTQAPMPVYVSNSTGSLYGEAIIDGRPSFTLLEAQGNGTGAWSTLHQRSQDSWIQQCAENTQGLFMLSIVLAILIMVSLRVREHEAKSSGGMLKRALVNRWLGFGPDSFKSIHEIEDKK